MELAKVTSKGQMTIPKKIRARLGLHRGDIVGLETDGNRIVLTKVSSRDALQKRHSRQETDAHTQRRLVYPESVGMQWLCILRIRGASQSYEQSRNARRVV